MNVLFDLSSIIRLGGEKEDALFFLNMILKYLWDKNLEEGSTNYNGLKHITMVEDAQYFAPQDLVKKNKLTTYLEDIALLQRGTGECLIALATRPDISRDILANCGVLILFKSHMERELLCEMLNLDNERREYISILEEGQCIARINSIKEPFLLWVPFIERESLNFSEIRSKNELILKNRDQILEIKSNVKIIGSYFLVSGINIYLSIEYISYGFICYRTYSYISNGKWNYNYMTIYPCRCSYNICSRIY